MLFKNHDNTSKAEIILNLYQNIREAAGNMYLIGCNTISHLAAGVFELNRIGDDTSGNEWSRTLKMGVNISGKFIGYQLVVYFFACHSDKGGILIVAYSGA